jgi:hypothetical protein
MSDPNEILTNAAKSGDLKESVRFRLSQAKRLCEKPMKPHIREGLQEVRPFVEAMAEGLTGPPIGVVPNCPSAASEARVVLAKIDDRLQNAPRAKGRTSTPLIDLI